jgi:hypothetical protein
VRDLPPGPAALPDQEIKESDPRVEMVSITYSQSVAAGKICVRVYLRVNIEVFM